MNYFTKSGVRALAVLAVVGAPLLAFQMVSDKSSAGRTLHSSAADEPQIGAATPVSAQSWTILPNIKNPRFESTAIQYRDDVYVFNGFGAGINVEPAVEKFDAGTQKWTVIGNTSVGLGNAVTHNGVIVNGNEVWMIGGRIGNHPGAVTANVWKFNLDTYNWSKGPKLPVPVAAGGAALLDNRIHWFGGLDANASCDVANHYVYELDNPSAGWTNISGIAPMPIPRNHFATVVHDGLIYAIGGQFTHDGCGAGTPDSNLVHVFDPATNYWTQLASLPAVQSHIEPSTFVHKGAIYVVGGATAGNKVYRYDPSNDNWDTVAVLPKALLAPIARVVDDRLVVSSGGAPATVPSWATYSIDMAPLLLPNAVDDADTPTASDPSTEPTIDDTGEPGLVTLEAEYYDTINQSDTHQWVSTNLAGASNNAAMITTPDSNKLANGTNGSPAMAYFAHFDRPGTWYLWVRGWGDSVNGEGKNDSLHAGLNGTLSATADKIDNFPSGWNWSKSTRDGVRAKLEIPSAGIHAVNLWMREDGLAVDKILLTTDANYQPSGKGDSPADNVTASTSADDTNNDNINNDASTDIDFNDQTTLGDNQSDDNQNDSDATDDTLNSTTDDTTDDPTNDVTNNTETPSNDNTTDADSTSDNTSLTDDQPNNSDGIIALEAEDFDTTVGASGKQWVSASKSGASGNGSMVTTPDTGVLKNSKLGSPVMNYQVHFSKAGTYQVWVRGWGDTVGKEGKSDSLHVGINGTLNTATAIQNFPAGWHWSSEKRSAGAATISVPSPGSHTINVWMREDGLIVDKLILSADPAYMPSDQGPAATVLSHSDTGHSDTGDSDTGDSDTGDNDTATQEPDDSTTTSTDVADDDSQDQQPTTVPTNLIAVEVENYASKSGSGAHQWLTDTTAGASGQAMAASPNTGKLNPSANAAAAMNYPLEFSEPGNYKVWLRGWGDSNSIGKNDSVYVSINGATQTLEKFPSGWNWSNMKRGGGSVTFNIPTSGTHTLKLSMREDGILLDKLVVTKDTTFTPVNLGPSATVNISSDSAATTVTPTTENFVAIRIEAEDYTEKNDRWVLTSPGNVPNFQDDPDGPHNNSASGNANLELLPDTRVTHSDPVSGGPDGSLWGAPGPGPSIDYMVNIPKPGRYLVYAKTYSTGSEDNGIHVGINGTTPESGKRMQTCAKNKWVWTSAQRTNEEHCGVSKQIWLDVTSAGPNKITFYAREDGFELDQILLLKETHDGSLDCYPTFGDDIRCDNATTGAKISDTDIPISATVR